MFDHVFFLYFPNVSKYPEISIYLSSHQKILFKKENIIHKEDFTEMQYAICHRTRLSGETAFQILSEESP